MARRRARDYLTALAVLIAVGAAVAIVAVGPSAAAGLTLVAVIAAVAMALLARRQVGGYTGDNNPAYRAELTQDGGAEVDTWFWRG